MEKNQIYEVVKHGASLSSWVSSGYCSFTRKSVLLPVGTKIR